MPARRRSPLLLVAVLCALALASCGPARQPFAATAPWADGETTRYDVTGLDGAPRGTASWTWNRSGDGWTEHFEVVTRGKPERGTVDLDAHLHPRATHVERDGATTGLTYGESAIASHATAKDGKATDTSIDRPADAVDNEASLQVQRGLPFAPGYATAYADVIPKTGATARIEVTVAGEEEVTVPAGTFSTWHLKMSAGMIAHEVWYAKDDPHLLVRYKNLAGGSTFVLRSWQASAGGEVHGRADPAPVPPPRAGPAPIGAGFLAATVLVQIPLMLALPILLGRWLARRYGCGWKPWGAGALAFVLSQVVHVPFNWATGLLGGGRGLGLLPLPLMALAAGLSAGVCEEVARYLMMRYGLKRARSFREAVQFGVGHGGVEAMILGALVLVALVFMLALRFLPPGALGGETVAAAADAYWRSPWDKPVLGGAERVIAITAHVGMSVMVMRAVVRGRIGWLFAAIGCHTALDAFAVWGMSRFGALGTEAGAAVFALGLAAAMWAMRDGAPATGAAPPAPESA